MGIAIIAGHVVNGSKVSLLVVKGVIVREAFEDVSFKEAKILVANAENGRMEAFAQFEGTFEWRSPDGKYRAFYTFKERNLLMHYTPLHREPTAIPTAP